MKTVGKVAIVFLLMLSQVAKATDSDSNVTCPINIDLTSEERNAFTGFNARLSHLRHYYGTPQFMPKLNEILATEWPEDRVIDISTSFMERVLNRVEQEYLRDAVASTLGLDNEHWYEFERVMRQVTIFGRQTGNKYGAFTQKTQALIDAIKRTPAKYFRTQGLTPEQREVYKARAITRIANMVLYLERWSELNRLISAQKAEATGKQLLITSATVVAGSALIASMVYAWPVVIGAGSFAAKFTADAVVAAQLVRIGQVVSGTALGTAGGPVTQLLIDSTSGLWTANRLAANNGTVLSCELDRQITEWRKRGTGPYLAAAALGAGSGALGGFMTFNKLGAQTVLYATGFGVSVMTLYSMGMMNDNSMKALAEYRLAYLALEEGDRERAKEHLRRSRAYDQATKERLIETIIVGALTVSTGAGFRTAVIEGEAAIRVLFANSADTLPLAIGVGIEAVRDYTSSAQ